MEKKKFEGKITLKREEKNFVAGFCILKSETEYLTEDLGLLHPLEKAYFDGLKFHRRKSSYLLGRLASKMAILQLGGARNPESILIDFGVFHFPVVKNSIIQNIQVSITHCEDIGISVAHPEEHPLAVDIEKIDEKKNDTFKTCMNTNELYLMQLQNLSLSVGYALSWTIKEGLSKILKTGITLDFNILEIASLDKEGPYYLSTFKNYPPQHG